MSDLKREGDATRRAPLRAASAQASSFRVLVVDGPDRGKELVVGPSSAGPILVGKGPASGLALTDPLVSRRHLSVAPEALALRVVDLGSTNGTFLGSARLTEVALSGGELLRIGDTTLRIELAETDTTATLWPINGFGRVVGSSVAMRRLYPTCQKLAGASLPVILEGETGTGKELLAESLHEMGPRSSRPFVVFDCSALADRNLERLLFGEEAAPGEARKGVFEEADGGTLLIDEIAQLPLPLQGKLLRALERGEICRVGSDQWVKVDTRVIATSRQNIDREVELGRFRDDLFFRLAAARIELPPLRRREGDVELLALHFWTRMAADRPPRPDLLAAFDGYGWPGNVRELQNLVAGKVALGDLDMPAEEPTPAGRALAADAFKRILEMDLAFPEARDRVLADFEHYFVERVLAKHGGNLSRAAAASGIARRYFQTLKSRSR